MFSLLLRTKHKIHLSLMGIQLVLQEFGYKSTIGQIEIEKKQKTQGITKVIRIHYLGIKCQSIQ